MLAGERHVFDKKLSKSLDFFYLEPDFYHSTTDIVEAMNTLIRETHNNDSCITVKVFRGSQKVEIYLENERSCLTLFCSNLGHNFRNNGVNEFGRLLRGKGPYKTKFAYDFVRIQSLII